MRRVLVLRPEPGASETVRRARELGLDASALPLFEVEAVAWQPPDVSGFDGILLTSANAVRFGGDSLHELRGLPVYTVGAATSEAARDAGFDVASTGDSGVDRLLGSINPDLKLLHLAGKDRKAPAEARQQICAVTVYRSGLKAAVDLGDVQDCVAMVHSPRAGRRLAELVSQSDRPTMVIAAISEEAGSAVGGGWAAVESARAPTDEALLVLTERLCNNPAQS